ncbi:apolipo protein A1 A4, putative [Babesia caballi]|uniref:Apolipo protein A1 A4, putative n=1 Tax=Babesia caballi TaxID=5871 RepID=A0AAV4LX44_BABCB|nr:apolipo protein A1 A4, putative [Babesia caballi]
MAKSARKLRKSQSRSEEDLSARSESAKPMVTMVAVHTENGEIKDFVPVDRSDSKGSDALESSCDELTPTACQDSTKAGSFGWLNQAIAIFNGASATGADADVATPKSRMNTATESVPDRTAQQPQDNHEEHLQIAQEHEGVVRSPDDQAQDVQDGKEVDHASPKDPEVVGVVETAEKACDYVAERSGVAVSDKREVEEMINKALEAKLRVFAESYEMEKQALRAEQERMVQENAEQLREQVNGHISDMCSKLEDKLTAILVQKVDEDQLCDRIKSAIVDVKEEMQRSIKGDVDEKLKNAGTEFRDTLSGHISNIEQKMEVKLNDVYSRAEGSDEKVRQMSDHIMKEVDAKIQQRAKETSEEFTGYLYQVKTDIGEFRSKIAQSDEALEEVVAKMKTLGADLGHFDLKLDEQSTNIMEELNSKLSEVVRKNDLSNTMEQVRSLCKDLENKAAEFATQEVDGKLNVWAMDMEDKISQDFYRVIEDRIQTLNGNILKHLTNDVDLKLRGIVEPQSDEEISIKEAICKSVGVTVMERVATEMDAVVEETKTAIQKEIENAISHLKSVAELQKSRSDVGDCPSGMPVSENADCGSVQCSVSSKDCDDTLAKFTEMMQQCEMQLKDVNEASMRLRELKDQATVVIAQMKECIGLVANQSGSCSKEYAVPTKKCEKQPVTPLREPSVVFDAVESTAVNNLRGLPETRVASAGYAPNKVATIDPTRATKVQHVGTCNVKERKSSKVLPNLLCGYSFPLVSGDPPDHRCSTEPMEKPEAHLYRRTVNTNSERSFTYPSRPVEVKYVNVNGRVIKVTQERFKLSELANLPPVFAQGQSTSPESHYQHKRVYY